MRWKSREKRIAHREEKFRRYFADAGLLSVPLSRLPVVGLGGTTRGRLLAFQDEAGFVVDLGVVERLDPAQRTLSVRTPLSSLDGVGSLRMGDLRLDPASGQQIGLKCGRPGLPEPDKVAEVSVPRSSSALWKARLLIHLPVQQGHSEPLPVCVALFCSCGARWHSALLRYACR